MEADGVVSQNVKGKIFSLEIGHIVYKKNLEFYAEFKKANLS
jgi:hypothetical protein